MRHETHVYRCSQCGEEVRGRFPKMTDEPTHDEWIDQEDLVRRAAELRGRSCPQCGGRGLDFDRVE